MSKAQLVSFTPCGCALTHFSQETPKKLTANGVDWKTVHNTASDQGVHCLPADGLLNGQWSADTEFL